MSADPPSWLLLPTGCLLHILVETPDLNATCKAPEYISICIILKHLIDTLYWKHFGCHADYAGLSS